MSQSSKGNAALKFDTDLARAMSKDTGAERASIRLETVPSRGRFSQGSLAFRTRMARIARLGEMN